MLIVVWFCGIPSAAGLYEEALEKYRAGKFAEVTDILEKKTPKNAGDHNLLGWAFLRLNNTSEAINHFELSLSMEPHLYDSYCGLGYSYFQLGQFNKALEDFNKSISKNHKNIDCLLGKGLALERLQDTEKALEIFKEVLSINKDDHLALEKVTILSPQIDNKQKEGTEFFARGNYFWVKRDNKEVEPIFLKGVNMSFAVPGKFPTEFPEDEKIYLEWFNLISEMNANLIRVYTILPPQFYKAFRKYNEGRKFKERLFLIQGIWAELPAKSNFKDPEYISEIKKEIRNALDIIHGNANIPHRYGHAHGVYRTDISEYVLGFIFGREWEPPDLIAYNKSNYETNFNGRYLSIVNANPMEVWLTEMLDYLISYEHDQYKQQRPATFMNWPPLDPLYHQSESTFREALNFRRKTGELISDDIDYTKAFDEDVVSLDETKIIVNRTYRSGIFSSYHVYPYYPDFLRYEENYSKKSFPEGSNYYYNYLSDLKKHYKNIPLLISEFGLPTSRAIARFHPEGLNQGGLNENEQADGLKKLMLSIKEAECAGGIIFSWIDEWVKTNWMVKGNEERDHLWYNAEDTEESYGLIAMAPSGTKVKLRGKQSAWETSTLLYSKNSKLPFKILGDGFDGARNIKSVNADYDAGYIYLRIDIDGAIDWETVAYLIAINTAGKEGDHKLPFNLKLESPIGFEYVILIHGEKSRILIDDKYNRIVFDQNLLRFPGVSGYKENSNFRPADNDKGIFTELITIHPRRFSRDGKIFPERIYNASILRQGNLSDNSLSDFYYSKENNFVEIRIPWYLLNFSDPSRLQIIYSNKEHNITEGLRMIVVSYKPISKNDSNALDLKGKTNVTDIIPESLTDIPYYRWHSWDFPEYIMRPKKSYYVMKELFEKIKPPKLKIVLPVGFDFTSVIKNNYNSIDEFLKYKIEDFNAESPYGLALANLTYGLVKNDPFYILEAKSLFASSYNISTDLKEKELSHLGFQYTENLISGEYKKGFNTNDTLEPIHIEKNKLLTKDFKKIIIGKTAIRLKKNSTIIKTQVDRVTRDWLLAYNFKNPPWEFNKEHIVPWHEGEKIKEIIDYTDSNNLYIIWGTKAKRFGNNWYAPDADGIYRFMLTDDKIYNYPTNIIIDDQNVIINDTHGINVIAWDSINADLVLGCGDFEGKTDAAYYLAEKGVNVYMPTDRFIGTLIGTHTKGTIIGSAPIKKSTDGAVIGDQPISIDINEPIVVSNSDGGYPLQYYDAPYRYFKELERYTGKTMNIIPVNITEYGKGSVVVEEAKKIGSKLIGLRVWGKEEHDSVYSWLREDKTNRAVLFHSVIYPEGYRLFFEFPGQTSFGDINIYFEN